MPRAKKAIVESPNVVVVPVEKPHKNQIHPNGNQTATKPSTESVPKRNQTGTKSNTESVPSAIPKPVQVLRRIQTERRPSAMPKNTMTLLESMPSVLLVHHLPNFEDDRRLDPKAEARYCGDVASGTSELEREIAMRFPYGEGYYRISERHPNGTIKTQWVLKVADPSMYEDQFEEQEFEDDDFETEPTIDPDRPSRRELHLAVQVAQMEAEAKVRREYETRQPVATSGNRLSEIREMLAFAKELQPPVSSAARPAKSLVEQLQELREVEKALGINRDEARNNPSDPTLAILKMLVDDPDSVNSVAGKVRGLFTGESPMPETQNSWNDVLMNLADNVFSSPSFGNAVGGFLGNLTAYVPGIMERFGVAPAQGNNNAVIDDPEAVPVAVPAQIAANRPAQPKGLNPQEALQVIFNELSENKPVDRAAGIARQLLKTSYAPMIEQIIQTPVAQLIAEFKKEAQFAPFGALPHVEQWLTALQAALQDEVPMLDEPDANEAESEDAS